MSKFNLGLALLEFLSFQCLTTVHCMYDLCCVQVIKDDMWPNPLQYYLAPDIEVEENGIR